MARVFSKQKRSTLMSQALQEIREAIRKGKLKPGDRLVEMQQASKNDDLDKLISEDFRFHQTICELSDHRKLLGVWLTLENQLRVFLTIEKQLFGNSAQFVKSHIPILEAIRERKIRPAQKAIRDHLDWAMQVIRQGYWEKLPK